MRFAFANARGWLLFATINAVAMFVALRAPAPAPPRALDRAEARSVYELVAREEPAMRIAAARAFPGDSWSQDDDFHARERDRVRTFAGEREARVDDALRAIDDGLREGWAPIGALTPRAPPCRPRLDY